MAGRDEGVRLEGFREFRRDLRKLEPAVAKGLSADIKAAAAKVAADARATAPHVTGKYAASIRPYVTARGASVGSRLPQAGVLHYGGTIQPRGVPITFPARPVVSEALDRRTDQIVDEVGDAVERAARAAGWH
jgi:phage gpG-like protein